jgi:hypothetical protein
LICDEIWFTAWDPNMPPGKKTDSKTLDFGQRLT